MSERARLKSAKMVIIKVGTKVLLDDTGSLNVSMIKKLVDEIALLHKEGRRVVLVTSGAIGAGMKALGLKKRPKDLPMLQACAALGQVKLMRYYEDFFSGHGILAGQVLLTYEDLKNRTRHLNAQNTFSTLLEHRIIPIVNENDAVSVSELKFGDNDVLASLVGMLLLADVLVLLTTASGFLIDGERVSHITGVSKELFSHIEEHKEGLSLGGMKSKIMAAANMGYVGGVSIIAPGALDGVLNKIFSGQDVGTLVGSLNTELPFMKSKKRWIAFYHRSKEAVIVDDGAKKAIQLKKSLLAIGIKDILGEFTKGSVVEVKDLSGQSFARGISQYSSLELAKIIKEDAKGVKEVIHQDSLVEITE